MTKEEFRAVVAEGIPSKLPAPKPRDPEINHLRVAKIFSAMKRRNWPFATHCAIFPKSFTKNLLPSLRRS